jgi:hypothetical protein
LAWHAPFHHTLSAHEVRFFFLNLTIRTQFHSID